MISKLKDPISGLTHLFGAILSIVALIFLLRNAIITGRNLYIVSGAVFGVSLILLYSASATYHLVKISDSITKLLRKIDHMMIYILIAGTYTPICLITLKGTLGNYLLVSIWSTAILGILLKIFWFNAPRWISTLFYILMGWMAIGAFVPIFRSTSLAGVFWLVCGGVLYSIGGLIYAAKWPIRNAKYFGFHEIFHLFVLAGSTCHFLMIFNYVM